jgi:hypothetical protein
MESVTRNVSEIQAGEKQWLETLLGQQLRENQQVFIMIFTPNVVPEEGTRRAAAARMEQTFKKADAHAREHGVTAEETDAAVQEAMDHVRHSEA